MFCGFAVLRMFCVLKWFWVMCSWQTSLPCIVGELAHFWPLGHTCSLHKKQKSKCCWVSLPTPCRLQTQTIKEIPLLYTYPRSPLPSLNPLRPWLKKKTLFNLIKETFLVFSWNFVSSLKVLTDPYFHRLRLRIFDDSFGLETNSSISSRKSVFEEPSPPHHRWHCLHCLCCRHCKCQCHHHNHHHHQTISLNSAQFIIQVMAQTKWKFHPHFFFKF